MRLCGISSRFQLLSPCVRQVIHALLTRPPLSHRTINPEGDQVKCFVRLACVKHAASVHPEPGSNSHKKFFPFQNQLANFNHSLIPNVTVLGCFDFRLCCSLELILMRISSLFSMNLSRLFHCSVIKVLCLLPFSNFYILPDVQSLVNNFFIFLFVVLCDSSIILPCTRLFVNNFFSCFLIDSGEGGI